MADPEEFTKFMDAVDLAGFHIPRKLAVMVWNMLSEKESKTIERCIQILEIAKDMPQAKEALKKFKNGVTYVPA